MLKFNAYKMKDLQTIKAFLTQIESDHVVSIDAEIDRRINSKEVAMSKEAKQEAVRKNIEQQKIIDKNKKENSDVVYQGRFRCPKCEENPHRTVAPFLTIKKLEGVTYTACPQCYHTVEFK